MHLDPLPIPIYQPSFLALKSQSKLRATITDWRNATTAAAFLCLDSVLSTIQANSPSPPLSATSTWAAPLLDLPKPSLSSTPLSSALSQPHHLPSFGLVIHCHVIKPALLAFSLGERPHSGFSQTVSSTTDHRAARRLFDELRPLCGVVSWTSVLSS